MKLTTIGTVIAERTLDLSPRGNVIVRIGKPRKTRGFNDYFCPFEIRGLSQHWLSYIVGLDSMQSLELALKHIGALLYMSDEAKAGRLGWVGDNDLGFPRSDLMSDLRPAPRKATTRKATHSSSRKRSKRA
jgi:hypothetical protein